ncbi:MAG: hypothetical protein ABIO70_27495 [Pseudomonadota bacterium]
MILPLILTSAVLNAQALPEAVSAGSVGVVFRGADASSGDSILLEAENHTDVALSLTVPAGLVLRNGHESSQDMGVRSLRGRSEGGGMFVMTSTIDLPAHGKGTWVIEAYCLEFHDDNPSSLETLTIARVDDALARLFAVDAQTLDLQVAVWAYTDDPPAAELQAKFPADDAVIERAAQLYERALGGACGRVMFRDTDGCSDAKPSKSQVRAWVPVPPVQKTQCESAREAATEAWREAVMWATGVDDRAFRNPPDLSGVQPYITAQLLAAEGTPAEAHAAALAAPETMGSPSGEAAIQRARAASERAWEVCGP